MKSTDHHLQWQVSAVVTGLSARRFELNRVWRAAQDNVYGLQHDQDRLSIQPQRPDG